MDRGAWQAAVPGVERVRHNLATKSPPPLFHSSDRWEGGYRSRSCFLQTFGVNLRAPAGRNEWTSGSYSHVKLWNPMSSSRTSNPTYVTSTFLQGLSKQGTLTFFEKLDGRFSDRGSIVEVRSQWPKFKVPRAFQTATNASFSTPPSSFSSAPWNTGVRTP